MENTKSTRMAINTYTHRYTLDISRAVRLPASIVSVRVAGMRSSVNSSDQEPVEVAMSPGMRVVSTPTPPIAPAELVFEDLYADMKVVIAGAAKLFSDPSCPPLAYEELLGEGNLKISELITSKKLFSFPDRVQFFKYFKTVISNMFRSLVQRYRGTQKRTGLVQPKKGSGESLRKPKEVSLDDEDVHFDVAGGVDTSSEAFEEICSYVSPVEKLVLKEEVEPSLSTHCLALLDAVHGLPEGEAVNVRITRKHKAEALGMEVPMYTELLKSSRNKIRRRMTEKSQEIDDSIARLSAIFGVQVPPNMDITIVRRLFSIAARQQYDAKVHNNEDTCGLLRSIGAHIPEVRQNGKVMACFGILYQKNHHVCNACCAKEKCADSAANLGLGELTISRRLLSPARNQRVPVIMARDSSSEPVFQLDRDKILLEYLDKNCKKYGVKGSVYYAHKERLRDSSPIHLFCLGRKELPLELRFINPDSSLLTKLQCVSMGRHKNWYLNDESTAEEALEMIMKHATNVYELHTSSD